ncbi:MAG: ATPase [Saprospiraceae bacterium]|nr:MAG: ATPase [Saprospiraceae bacterium]
MNNKPDTKAIIQGFDQLGYVAGEELATLIFLMTRLHKPLLLEGHPGVGKTEVANMLAGFLNTKLIRLQCYEGLDVNTAIYEWNYQKQLLGIKIQENSGLSANEKEQHIFGADYLLERPLLQAITSLESSPVLLIDEIDRADEEFEAFLLELLSVYQISIPELGTIRAKHKPYVILTSNRTRELGDALKRRCLYHWMHYPQLEMELQIVSKKLPDIEQKLAKQVVQLVQSLRQQRLSKTPGIAETLDWAMSLLALGYDSIDEKAIEKTLGCVLKSTEDIAFIKTEGMEKLLESLNA